MSATHIHVVDVETTGLEPASDRVVEIAAVKEILDGRNPDVDCSKILVTAEHAITALLLLLMRDPSKAAKMLNEGLLQGVEERLALYASKGCPHD